MSGRDSAYYCVYAQTSHTDSFSGSLKASLTNRLVLFLAINNPIIILSPISVVNDATEKCSKLGVELSHRVRYLTQLLYSRPQQHLGPKLGFSRNVQVPPSLPPM